MREYVEIKPNKSQYDGQSFNYGKITEAIYVESPHTSDNGNKYIEALPVIPDQDTISNLNYKLLTNFDNTSNKSEIQKLREIQELSNIRFPMPYDTELWTNIYLTMVESYSKRAEMAGRIANTITINDCELENKTHLVANSYSAPIGFNMIGPSGCGKSSALEIALSYYPKVIRHINDDGSMSIQIPYIYVTCPPDSNFKALFEKIGKEIDKYLGNTIPTVEKEIMGAKNSKIGEIATRLCSVIEQYAIGLIVLDEIQQLSFSSTKENSFNTLMTLVNDSMVGLGLVGTEEVIAKIVKKPQFSRRVGNRIVCDIYTKNEDFFNMLFNTLSFYQWGNEKVVFSDEIKHEVYMESHGIIAYLVLIYSMVWSYYISSNGDEEINLKYVKNIIEKYFSLIKTALNRDDLSETERDYYAKLQYDNAKDRLVNDVSQVSQENIMQQMIEKPLKTTKDLAKQSVITYVKDAYDEFTDEQILKAFDSIYKDNKTTKELRRDTFTKLTNKRRPRRRMSNSNTGAIEDDILLSIKESVGDPNNPI